jgi:energy-coupling factor transport system substrate-specific component
MTAARTLRPPTGIPLTFALLLVSLAAAIDIVGANVAVALGLPVFLDTIGTFVAAVVLGPWWGALVGILNNGVGALTPLGVNNLPFAVVSVAVAVVWGYGVRRLGFGRNAATFFVLNVVVAVVTALVASPIALFVYGGSTGHPSDAITAALEVTGQGLAQAVAVSNLVINMGDKLITASAGLALVQALPASYIAGVRLPAATRLGTLGMAVAGIVIGAALAGVFLVMTAKPA